MPKAMAESRQAAPDRSQAVALAHLHGVLAHLHGVTVDTGQHLGQVARHD